MRESTTMPVLVYLAGASREHERVKRWAHAIDRARCLEVSHRWFEDAETWHGKDHELTRARARDIAQEDERHIRASRIFWLLWPIELRPGAFIELGHALCHRFHVGRSYDVIVSGAGCCSSIFTASADFRDDSDELAFDALLQLARRHLPLKAAR